MVYTFKGIKGRRCHQTHIKPQNFNLLCVILSCRSIHLPVTDTYSSRTNCLLYDVSFTVHLYKCMDAFLPSSFCCQVLWTDEMAFSSPASSIYISFLNLVDVQTNKLCWWFPLCICTALSSAFFFIAPLLCLAFFHLFVCSTCASQSFQTI